MLPTSTPWPCSATARQPAGGHPAPRSAPHHHPAACKRQQHRPHLQRHRRRCAGGRLRVFRPAAEVQHPGLRRRAARCGRCAPGEPAVVSRTPRERQERGQRPALCSRPELCMLGSFRRPCSVPVRSLLLASVCHAAVLPATDPCGLQRCPRGPVSRRAAERQRCCWRCCSPAAGPRCCCCAHQRGRSARCPGSRAAAGAGGPQVGSTAGGSASR